MTNFKAESFVNSFGQVINPGDDIIYAGTSWKSTTFRRGKFAGSYYGTVSRRIYQKDNDGNLVRDEHGYAKSDIVREYVPIASKIEHVQDKKWVYDLVKKQGNREPCIRTARLPLKRVFKLDTKISDMENTSF